MRNKHFEWFENLDIDALEAEAPVIPTETVVDAEIEEAQLLWDHFRDTKE